MVQIYSAPVLGLLLLVLGASAIPAKSGSASKVITYEDIKNATPNVPAVTDPAQKPLSGDASDNSTVLQARPDLAGVVNDAKTTLPKLLADDKPPKGASKNGRRDLFKRAKETCEIFTNGKDQGIQATPAALALAAQKACATWFPGTSIYAVPEATKQSATFFNQLTLEYHVRDTSCSPYKAPIHEYYVISQAICVAQFTKLFSLADTLCAGDHTGVSSSKDTSVPIWYSWKTFE